MNDYVALRDPRLLKRSISESDDLSGPPNKRTIHHRPSRPGSPGGSPRACRTGPTPFNQSGGDIILRSCDSIDFHVKSAILVEVSGYFHNSLSHLLAKRAEKGTTNKAAEGLPIICVTENSEMLNVILRLCYPLDEPTIRTPAALCDIIYVATKYEMDYVTKKLIRPFKAFAEEEPLKMYIAACRRRWLTGMNIAARASLGRSIQAGDLMEIENVETNQFITALELLRLQAYHKACGQAAGNVIGTVVAADLASSQLKLSWLPHAEWAWFTCRHKLGVTSDEKILIRNGLEMSAAKWWTIYLRKAQEKLRSRPCGATVLDPKPFAAFAAAAMEYCGACKRQFIEDLLAFNRLLAEQVEKAVDEVEFDTKQVQNPQPQSRLQTHDDASSKGQRPAA
ncbi:hypothetical protein BDW22DRAFT_1356995 [Trametopsis cervina]|nr:hypothetical protein BDW22DRAFT_1356995 [Trametopsis cervina]